MRQFLRISYWILGISFALLMIAAATGALVPDIAQGTPQDLLLYKLSLISIFSAFALCTLIGLLSSYFPKIQKIKLSKKLLTCAIILTIGIIACATLYFCTGKPFQDALAAMNAGTAMPAPVNDKSPVIDTVPTETAPTEIAPTEIETVPTQAKQEYVTEDAPLTFFFDDKVFTVGTCDFTIDKLEMIYRIHKASPDNTSYAKFVRLHITVTNNSSQETLFYAKKEGSWHIGQYHAPDGTVENIGANNNYKWQVDPDLKSASDFSLEPQETKTMCVTGVFINDEQLKYDDEPQIDFFFRNGDDALTVSVK